GGLRGGAGCSRLLDLRGAGAQVHAHARGTGDLARVAGDGPGPLAESAATALGFAAAAGLGVVAGALGRRVLAAGTAAWLAGLRRHRPAVSVGPDPVDVRQRALPAGAGQPGRRGAVAR